MTLIGRPLSEVRSSLSDYEIVVIDNASAKVDRYDEMLVTNVRFCGQTCYLTVSPFLINID